MIIGREELKRTVRAAVRETPAVDLYTRLSWRSLLHDGGDTMDLLLTQPAIEAEARRYGDVRMLSENRAERAEAVFATLFIERSPISAQAQAVLYSLRKVGIDAGTRDLCKLRRLWAGRPAEERVLDVLDMTNLAKVAVRVDLFEKAQAPSAFDERLSASLCLNALHDIQAAWPMLAERGCRSYMDIRGLIAETAESLSAGSLLVDEAFEGPAWEECVLPTAEMLGMPLIIASKVEDGLPEAGELAARFLKEGLSFRPYRSGAAVVEQLPGLWEMARRAIIDALTAVYAPLLKTGWALSAGEVTHDIEQLMGKDGRCA